MIAILVVGCGSEGGEERTNLVEAGAEAAPTSFGDRCERFPGTARPVHGGCVELVDALKTCPTADSGSDSFCRVACAGQPEICMFECKGEGCDSFCQSMGGRYAPISYVCSPLEA